ncbi:MAG: Crp/Fnr family transcriptional regulator [Cellvibrionaceae bacterium]
MEHRFLDDIGLTPAFLKEKKIAANELHFEAGQVLFQSGDACGAFLILVKGQLRVEMTTKSGREIVLYRMHENDTCIMTTSVLLNHEHYYARATTETAITAIAIPAADFHRALQYSTTFTRYVLSGYAQRMSALIQLLDRVASKDILYELSSLLLRHCDEQNFVQMQQDAIAKEVGTVREVVSRKLAMLESEGVVKTHRGRVEIINRTYLEKVILI